MRDTPLPWVPTSCPVEAIRGCPALVQDFDGCTAGARALVAQYQALSCAEPDGYNAGVGVPAGATQSCIELLENCPGVLDVIAR